MLDSKVKRLVRSGAAAWMHWAATGLIVGALAVTMASAHAQPQGGPGMMMFGGSPEHAGRAVDHLLDGLNATDAQRTQIKQIAATAAADLKAQHEAGKALHEKGLQIFMAPTVDATAAESLRQQLQAQHDQASKRVLQAMLDVSKVLTPEQRATLGERMKQRQTMMHDHMRRTPREKPAQ